MTKQAFARPRVTLKLATSLDGQIATKTGASKWITGPQSRERVHQMRAQHDCVLTGIGTILADDAELTSRTDPRPSCQPLRAVLDSQARTPTDGRLLKSLDQGPVCLFHRTGTTQPIAGTTQIRIEPDRRQGGLDLEAALDALARQFGVTTVMVEAGSRVAGSFLRAGLVARLVWFRAPIIIGGDGVSVFSALGVEALTDVWAFERVDLSRLGDDTVETYQAKSRD